MNANAPNPKETGNITGSRIHTQLICISPVTLSNSRTNVIYARYFINFSYLPLQFTQLSGKVKPSFLEVFYDC